MKRLIIYIILAFIILFFFCLGSNATVAKTSIVYAQDSSFTKDALKIDPLFEKIAYCESKNDPHAKNPYSTASGRFQFLWGSWNYYGKQLWGDKFYEKNVFNYKDNTELAKYVYDRYGTSPWDASAYCWSS